MFWSYTIYLFWVKRAALNLAHRKPSERMNTGTSSEVPQYSSRPQLMTNPRPPARAPTNPVSRVISHPKEQINTPVICCQSLPERETVLKLPLKH